MKKIKNYFLTFIICSAQFVFAQSEKPNLLLASIDQKDKFETNLKTESINNLSISAKPIDTVKSKWNVNFDVSLTSRFIWRGLELGEYPSIQPNATFSKGNFFAGIWSSHALSPAETAKGNITGYKEVIPYIGYGFKISKNSNLTLMLLDHYNPNFGDFLDFDSNAKTNRGEIRTLFNLGKFDFLGSADVINDPSDNTSIYIELGYTFDMPNDVKVRPLVSFTPSDNYYTIDGKADITQIGFITSKNVIISKSFSLPLKVDMIYNPDRKKLYTAFTVSVKF